MKITDGFSNKEDTRVCRLRKSCMVFFNHHETGTKSSPCHSQDLIFGNRRMTHRCLSTTSTLIYVDDVIITGNNMLKIKEMKVFLDKELNIKDSGHLKYFLGIEVARTSGSIPFISLKTVENKDVYPIHSRWNKI